MSKQFYNPSRKDRKPHMEVGMMKHLWFSLIVLVMLLGCLAWLLFHPLW